MEVRFLKHNAYKVLEPGVYVTKNEQNQHYKFSTTEFCAEESKSKRMNKITVYISVLFLFLLSRVDAQTYYFDTYSVKEGLAQSKVYTSFQDEVGHLWIGTPSGLSRFDGKVFRNFTTADNLSDGGVQAIVADKEGNLWFGHIGGGLSYWNGQEFRKLKLPNIKIAGDINDIALDKDNNIWLATIGAGAIKISNVFGSNRRVTQYRGREGLGDRVYKIASTKDGKLFFIIDGSIKEYDPDVNGFEFYRPDGLSFFAQFTDMMEDSQGYLWFGTYQNGLYRYDKIRQHTDYFYKRDGLAGNFITSITEDRHKNIWIGSFSGGISRIKGDSIKTFTTKDGLPDNVIRSLMVDREGNLIIGTYNSGLSIFKGELFVLYNDKFGFPSPQVNAILHDGNNIWFGTEKGLLLYNSTTKEKITYTRDDGLLSNDVILLRRDRDGNIWIGCSEGGIVQFNKKEGKFIEHPRANASNNSEKIRAMEIDSENNLWVGTWDGVVYYEIDNDSYNLLSQRDGLAGNNVRSIFADSRGRVWFGSVDKGATYVLGNKFSTVVLDSTLGIGSYTPSSFAEDTQGRIWIGTEDDGLLVFDGSAVVKQYRIEDGLLSNYIASIEIDNNDRVWVGTGAGVNRISPKDGKIHFYNEKSGFTGIEVRPKATFKDSLGNIWFGTAKGVNVLQTGHETQRVMEPLTRITRLRVNLKDRSFNPDINIQLNYKEYSVYINYSAVWLSNPDGITYKVKLEGLDKDWQPETNQTEINYPYLKPGKYTFKVMARNHEGTWNKHPTSFTFTINPPIWQRTWFIVLMFVLLVATIYLYILWRERNHRLERIKLENIVQQRTAEIAQKNEELAERNRDITDSIRYAKRIQNAVMPSKEKMQEILPDHFIVFRPRDIVSGDYYWVSELGTKTVVAAVDCTGHGVPGAFLSMLGVAFLNEIVSKGLATSAADILEHLREYIITSLKQTSKQGGSQDGMDMALVIIDPEKQELQFAGANNPLIFISDGVSQSLKADKMPIGIYQRGDKKFSNHSLSYKTGDTFYIFSDGYPDQFGGEKGRKFMRKRFQKLLADIQDKGMPEQGSILDMEFEKWKGSLDQVDDVLVMGVRL